MENMCSYAYFCYFFECHFKPNFIRSDFVLAINHVVLTTIDKDWFVARNIGKDKAIANLVKISRMRVKISLQFYVYRSTVLF